MEQEAGELSDAQLDMVAGGVGEIPAKERVADTAARVDHIQDLLRDVASDMPPSKFDLNQTKQVKAGAADAAVMQETAKLMQQFEQSHDLQGRAAKSKVQSADDGFAKLLKGARSDQLATQAEEKETAARQKKGLAIVSEDEAKVLMRMEKVLERLSGLDDAKVKKTTAVSIGIEDLTSIRKKSADMANDPKQEAIAAKAGKIKEEPLPGTRAGLLSELRELNARFGELQIVEGRRGVSKA